MQSNGSSIFLAFLPQAIIYKVSASNVWKNFGKQFNVWNFVIIVWYEKWIIISVLTIYDVDANASPPKKPNNPPKNGIHTAINPTTAAKKWKIHVRYT